MHGSLGFAARGRLIADADSDAAAVADFPTEPATLVICAPASSILVLSLAYLTVPSRGANAIRARSGEPDDRQPARSQSHPPYNR